MFACRRIAYATVGESKQLELPPNVQGLQMLNAAGYGREGSGLELDLVYNPNGAFLAPAQAALEEAYRTVRSTSAPSDCTTVRAPMSRSWAVMHFSSNSVEPKLLA